MCFLIQLPLEWQVLVTCPLSTETSGALGNIVDGTVSQVICYVSSGLLHNKLSYLRNFANPKKKCYGSLEISVA